MYIFPAIFCFFFEDEDFVSSRCLGTCYVYQSGLDLIEIHLQSDGIKGINYHTQFLVLKQ